MKKQSNIIIRITDIEKKMIKELKTNHSINMSALIRKFIKEYYESKKEKT